MARETINPKDGDLIWYLPDFTNGEEVCPNHVGIVRNDGLVESKWGMGPTLLHPLEFVPSNYGAYVTFSSDFTQEQKKRLES